MAKRYETYGNLKDRAKGNMENKYSQAVMIMLVYAGLTYLLLGLISYVNDGIAEMILSVVGESVAAVLGLALFCELVSAFASVILGMMLAGIALFFLKAACGQWPVSSDIWTGVRENPGRTFRIALVVSGLEALCLLPANICGYMSQYLSGDIWRIMMALLLIVGTIVYALGFMGLSLSYFMMFDFPNLSAWEVVRECNKRLKGNRVRFAGLMLSFIPLMLLVVLSFGIGIFWVWPYMMETRAAFYLDLMNPKEVSGEWQRTV